MTLAAPAAPSPGRQRAGRDGTLRLRFERRGPRTVVAASAWTVPLQVLAPVALDDSAAIVSVLNPTGGLVGGDRLTIEIDVEAGAHACVTTPSATKVYRTSGRPAEQRVTVRLGHEAVLEWVPDHTIPFAGSAFRQTIEVEVADGATLFLTDAFSAGRIARGEAWQFAEIDSAITVVDPEGAVVHDRMVLRPRTDAWDGLDPTDGAPYVATSIVVADHGLAALADGGPERHDDAVAAVGRLPRRGVMVRCLARTAPGLHATLQATWRAARRHVLGMPALDLRKA